MLIHKGARARIAWRWGAMLVVCAGLTALATFVTVRSAAPEDAQHYLTPGIQGPSTGPTIDNPLPVAGTKQVSMSDAVSAFGDKSSGLGETLVLPNTSQVTPSDVGAVWMNEARGDTKLDTAIAVALTFPKQDMFIVYTAPAPADPATYIEQAVKEYQPGSQLISLNGVPAWAEPYEGTSWGMIQFIVGGVTIQVNGHTDLAFLQTIAQSIVDRASNAG